MNFDMNKLMEEAQKLQEKVEQKKREIGSLTVNSTSGGGMVKVMMRGDYTLEDITIHPDCVDANDVETLQELVMVAVNEAVVKVVELNQTEMGKLTGGMGLPGM
jgi:DNA-binding YbaB/EbfC family protein